MDNITPQAQPAVADLLQMDVPQLYEQLGIRARALREDPSLAGSFAPTVTYRAEEMGLLEDVQDFGKRVFGRINQQAYGLLCGQGDDFKEEQDKIKAAFDKGIETVAGVLATALVTSVGIAPAVATVVAAIVVKLFFRATYQATCDVWGQGVSSGTGG